MRYSLRTKAIATFAGVAGIALVASGCSNSTPVAEGTEVDTETPITLTITTFGTMGLDTLYAEYMAMNPNITIEATNLDGGGTAQTDWQTKQAAGAGLPDIQAIEEGWRSKVMLVSDSFTDLRSYGFEEVRDNWVDWKVEQATDPDGRVIGYGTDIGPEGLCYNGDLFEAAGLPSDREAVAEYFGGDDATWEKFFEIGREYNAETGKAWYDHSGFVWNAMVNQQEEGYYKKDGSLNVEGNETLKGLFLQLAQGSKDGLSSNQSAWAWGPSFTDGSFATFVCPGWMLGVVKGQTEENGGGPESGWDFADVFPGGQANWGGSWLTVPTTSEHPAEAAALAEWLTAPEQQVKVFKAVGVFPSSPQAQADPALKESSEISVFFNDAPVGEILAKRAEGVVAQYKGPEDATIQEQVFGPSIQAIDADKIDGEKAWNDALALLDELIVNN